MLYRCISSVLLMVFAVAMIVGCGKRIEAPNEQNRAAGAPAARAAAPTPTPAPGAPAADAPKAEDKKPEGSPEQPKDQQA